LVSKPNERTLADSAELWSEGATEEYKGNQNYILQKKQEYHILYQTNDNWHIIQR
jgi:hypothetical protein